MASRLFTNGMSDTPLKLIDAGDGGYALAVSSYKQQIFHKKNESIPGASNKILFETTAEASIEFLEFITHDLGDSENQGANLRIELRHNGIWETITVMRNVLNTYPHQKLTPSYLFENSSSLWETNVHNIEENIYKYSLRKPLNAYEGIRITALNDHETETKNLGVFFIGSEG